jgi:acyl-CoA synthetase (AMP-forming)/AMP-acid ligase II
MPETRIGEQTAFDLLTGHLQDRRAQVCLTLLHSGQPDCSATWGELAQASAGYARAYAAAGIAPGEVVILILQHGLDLVAAFWGAVLHGAVPSIMPFLTEKLLPERYRQDLAALVSVTRPAGVVTYPEFAAEVRGAINLRGALSDDSPVRALLVSDQVQPVEDVDLLSLSGRQRAVDDLVFLQHSSGTTGLQKGVAITHRALLNQLDSYRQAVRLTPDDVIVSWLPLYHDMGLIAGFLMPILEGVPLVLMSPFDWVRAPARLMQAVSRYRGTLTWLPNFAYNFCAQKIRDSQMQGVDLSSWRAVIDCSEPVHESSLLMFAERFAPYGFRREALAASYAMAENVFGVTQAGIDGPLVIDEIDRLALQEKRVARPPDEGRSALRMVSCGRPIPGTQVKVVDGEGRELPERHAGELALRSNCMLAGYYNRPDATAAAFRDGWYLTGDLGYMAGGEVYVSGRKKDLIIVGGRNVFPQDLEALAGEVDGVHPGRVVAFGVENEATGTEEVALVAEVDLSDEELRDVERVTALEDAIRLAVNHGSAVSLRYIRLVGPQWLIKTSSGKTARAANREKFLREFM